MALGRVNRGRRPYRGFNIFIYGRQGVCAFEGSHSRSDQEILILYRMALQFYGVGKVELSFSRGYEAVTRGERGGVRGVADGESEEWRTERYSLSI